jgi:two-component system LytT family response regulator
LAELSVDLLLLDIRLPGESGFDLLERLDNVPALIFTTAYDEFAVRAFEVNALELVTGLAAARAAIS